MMWTVQHLSCKFVYILNIRKRQLLIFGAVNSLRVVHVVD